MIRLRLRIFEVMMCVLIYSGLGGFVVLMKRKMSRVWVVFLMVMLSVKKMLIMESCVDLICRVMCVMK